MLGMLQFKKQTFKEMQNLFTQLSSGQNPETLFITCADSRIVPSLITQADPGELFVIRNIGNIIPPYPSWTSEAGAIEYALNAFNIKDIIICGHSQCGAMKGLLTPDIKLQLPAVASWLTHSLSVLDKMHDDHSDLINDPIVKLSIATKNNIIQQVNHLKTYPLIAKKIANNELTIHGWLYEIESGKVFIYESKSNEFLSLEEALLRAIEARKNKITTNLVMDFLQPLTGPKSAQEYQQLMRLFTSIKNNIQPIWHLIKEAVQQKLWIELGGLYTNPVDSKFLALVESCSQIKLTGLNTFQKNVSESYGYQQYCSQLIRSSFFSQPKTNNFCAENITVPASLAL